MIMLRRAVPDSAEDEKSDPPDNLSQHEWAEYNLPATLLIRIAAAAEGDDDALAFVGPWRRTRRRNPRSLSIKGIGFDENRLGLMMAAGKTVPARADPVQDSRRS